MTITVTELAAEFKAVDSLSVKSSFAQGLEREEMELLVEGGVMRLLMSGKILPSQSLMRDSFGQITSGSLTMIVAHKSDVEAVNTMLSWINILFKDPKDGGLSDRINAPFIYGTLRFWHYRPRNGEINATAEKWGPYWMAEQEIEYAAQKV